MNYLSSPHAAKAYFGRQLAVATPNLAPKQEQLFIHVAQQSQAEDGIIILANPPKRPSAALLHRCGINSRDVLVLRGSAERLIQKCQQLAGSQGIRAIVIWDLAWPADSDTRTDSRCPVFVAGDLTDDDDHDANINQALEARLSATRPVHNNHHYLNSNPHQTGQLRDRSRINLTSRFSRTAAYNCQPGTPSQGDNYRLPF